MFPVTITIHTPAQLNAVMAALQPTLADFVQSIDKTATEQAPGKPSAATTARSPRTAAAGPSPSAGPTAQADAPAQSTEATQQDAAATSAAQPAVTYPDLQKAVLTLHKMDATAAVPIAKGLGADTFKLLPEAKWAEALAQVNAAIEARKAA